MRRLQGLAVLTAILLGASVAAWAAPSQTLDVWVSMGGTDWDAFERVVADFERTHPGVDVTLTPAEGGTTTQDKMVAAVLGGISPDVLVYFDRFNTAQWSFTGILQRLDPFIASSRVLKPESFFEATWAESTYNGSVYSIPFETDSRVLFYNKTLFAEAGLGAPPQSWDELEAAAQKLTRTGPDGRYSQVGFVPWYSQGSLYLWGWAAGGEFYDPATGKITLAHPRNVQALEWMTEWAQRYGRAALDGFIGAGNNFPSQKLAMMISGPWELVPLRATGVDFGIATPPYPSNGRPITWAGGHASIIPEGAPHPELAWEFIEYISVGPGAVRWNQETTHIPAAIEVARHPEIYGDEQLRPF
ncbi:MAG TPA: ABC transporter substrate-binding protein, partial [Limnochordia bacterium]